MLRRFICFSLILLFATATVSSQDKSARISDELLQRGIDHGFPGIILAIQNGDAAPEINAKGFAILESKTLINPEDRFHIASVTKIFTAAAALILVDEGMLSLDEKALTILGAELLLRIPNIEQITVAQLLDHSSGIYGFNNDPEYIDVWLGSKYEPNKVWSAEELIAFADRDRVNPFGIPGKGNFYGDTNYVILGMIIEKKSGMSLRQFVFTKILKPLTLKDTAYYGETENECLFELPITVNGYLKRSEDLDSVVKLDKSFKPVNESLLNTTKAVERLDSGSGMVSTAGDLLKFGRALYSGKLLKKDSMKWLLSVGDGIEKEKIGTSRQGAIKFHRESYGVLYASTGDGPAGINVTLVYHPKSDKVIVGFANIFGLFDEADFMREAIFGELITAPV